MIDKYFKVECRDKIVQVTIIILAVWLGRRENFSRWTEEGWFNRSQTFSHSSQRNAAFVHQDSMKANNQRTVRRAYTR